MLILMCNKSDCEWVVSRNKWEKSCFYPLQKLWEIPPNPLGGISQTMGGISHFFPNITSFEILIEMALLHLKG